ncbi:MAG: protease inhibitor I42 family protein [Smithellaceae bacterium]|nr:protease inhibitor I42 family protein [Smithellaceae bacterium]
MTIKIARRTLIALLIITMAFLSGMVGLTTSDSRSPTDTAKMTPKPSAARSLEAALGEEFTIVLASNATTGYGWSLARPLDETVIRLIGSVYRVPETNPAVVGAGGKEIWTFSAVGKGKTEIFLKYVRPWEKDTPPAEERD